MTTRQGYPLPLLPPDDPIYKRGFFVGVTMLGKPRRSSEAAKEFQQPEEKPAEPLPNPEIPPEQPGR